MELKSIQQEKDFSKKNTYSAEEKKYIMDRLNAERKIQQKKTYIAKKYQTYTENEKRDILKELNKKRLEEQIYKEIKKKRTDKKKMYTFDVRSFYKILNMEREYYILTDDVKNLTARPKLITLYYKVFGEMKKRDYLMKIEFYSDKIFISNDVLRVYFKGHLLESEY